MRVRHALFTLLLFSLAGANPGFADSKHEGSLHVIASPGLGVYVDDQLIGVTTEKQGGLRVLALSSGDHRVRIQKAGYHSKRFVVHIHSGVVSELKVGTLEVKHRIRLKPREEPVETTPGSPPLVIDDTDTPGPGNWETNIFLSGDLSKDSDTYAAPRLDLNCGLGETVELSYEVPYVFTHEVETDEAGDRVATNAHGFGDSKFGVKYRFYDNDETDLSLALYPQIEFRTPDAKSKENGGAADAATTWVLPLLLTKDVSGSSITANVSLEKATDETHAHLLAGFGVGTRLTNALAILGEIVGDNLEIASEERVLLDVGFRLKRSERYAFLGALGTDLGTGDGQRHYYVNVGYQRSFGN